MSRRPDSFVHRAPETKGLVFAKSPFTQQIREGAYDFIRFTLSAARWLFRRFEQIHAGNVLSPRDMVSYYLTQSQSR